MNSPNFFASIRTSLFGGGLSQHQVDSINAILVFWTKHNGADPRQLAYILGTVYHEAGSGMNSVREGFAKTNEAAIAHVTAMFNHKEISKNYALPDAATGQSYYGRGFVQITWKGNYEAFQKLLNIPLVTNPDLALQVGVSAEIAVIGMINGIFTGKKLSDYFNGQTADWLNARRIINGTDKAQLIATYAQKFHTALTS